MSVNPVKPWTEWRTDNLEIYRAQCIWDLARSEQKLAEKTKKLRQANHRSQVLTAAQNALDYLEQSATHILNALEQAGAMPQLINEQRALVARYGGDRDRLPDFSKRTPLPTEIVIEDLKLEDIERHCNNLQNYISAISEELERRRGMGTAER